MRFVSFVFLKEMTALRLGALPHPTLIKNKLQSWPSFLGLVQIRVKYSVPIFLKTNNISRTVRARGRRAIVSKTQKNWEKSGFSGTTNKLFGINNVIQFLTIQISEQIGYNHSLTGQNMSGEYNFAQILLMFARIMII